MKFPLPAPTAPKINFVTTKYIIIWEDLIVIISPTDGLLAMTGDLAAAIPGRRKDTRRSAPSAEKIVNCLSGPRATGRFFAAPVLANKIMPARKDAIIIEEVLAAPISETNKCTKQLAPNAVKVAKFLFSPGQAKMFSVMPVLVKAPPVATEVAAASNPINNWK